MNDAARSRAALESVGQSDGPREEPLDVVARLADHQQNLVPAAPPPPRAALLALPLPPLARALLGDALVAARAQWLSRRAEEHGGGDGPLPIVDLEVDLELEMELELGLAAAATVHLEARLAPLAAAGIATLIVVGGAEQRGFARAVAARWPGSLERLELPLDALLAAIPALRNDERPPADGRVLVRALDPGRRLGAWWCCVPPAALLCTREGAELRAAWQRYWSARGWPDAVRCAVLGLDPLLDAALREPPSSPPSSPPPAPADPPLARHVAITGLDGAGKSTHAARLAASLAERGHAVAVVKIYRQGAFLELAGELGARTRRGAPLAAFRVSRLVKLLDSVRVLRDRLVPLAGRCDVVLLDRWLETHVAAAASQLGWELADHPLLAPFPRVDRRFWLELGAEEAIERLDARAERRSADEHATGLLGYAREFERLAAGPGEQRLSARAPLEENAAQLLREVVPLLAAPRRRGEVVAVENGAPPRLPLDAAHGRCRLHLGAHAERPELGRGLFELITFLRERSGGALSGVPEATWIEAYLVELLLALGTTRPARAAVALWPAALLAMEECADLPMVAELARLLDAETQVESASSDDEARRAADDAFRALGFAPAGAARFAASYSEALRATPRAWSAAPSAPAS
ncbi:MAG: hypothetical protein JNL90_00515 [Planctomycetes bacterium]|nr:hypothetical protein [Planctomycetota bacterium]